MRTLVIIFLFSQALFPLASEAEEEKKEFNKICPFNEHYIKFDRAYHECSHGFVNGSCDLFLKELAKLLPEYDCQRSFDKKGTVPAIWLAGGATEDFYGLLFKIASGNGFYSEKWFTASRLKAREICLSSEFRKVLDGHMAEEYFPLIDSMKP